MAPQQSPERRQRWNLFGDCLAIIVASIGATMTDRSPNLNYLVAAGMAFGTIAVWGATGRVLRHYDIGNGRGVRGDFALTLLLLAIVAMPLVALRWIVPAYAREAELGRFFAVLIPCVLWLRAMATWIRKQRALPPGEVLIVGVGAIGRLTSLDLRDGGRRKVHGFLHFSNESPTERVIAPILGTASSLENCLKTVMIEEVYIAGDAAQHQDEMQEAIRTCERFGIPLALPVCNFRMGRAKPADAKAVGDGYVHYLSVQNKPVQLAIKRMIDMIASGVALAFLSPLMIGVAIAIKLTSKGPVLFRQERAGLYGHPFHMLKFRSMVINAEELKAKLAALNEHKEGPVFKMARDPRITNVGRFIRKYSIDELPQLINVLRGEMTIVGPRPPIPSEVAKYEAWQRRRLSVRPGLTCLWQVSGRNQISFEEWMYLDMQYIDHWSLRQDLELILKTVPVVLTGRGAS